MLFFNTAYGFHLNGIMPICSCYNDLQTLLPMPWSMADSHIFSWAPPHNILAEPSFCAS